MFKDADVFFIAIVPALSAYEKELPRISQNIQNYNHILQKNSSNYISLDELPNDGIMSDYHHINKIGHKFIFNKIKEFA